MARFFTGSCQGDDASTSIGSSSAMMTSATSIDRGDRFLATSLADVIEQAVWLSIRFPLSLRMVEDVLAARGIIVSHEAVRCRAETFGRICASKIRRRAAQFGDKWHLDEVVLDQRQEALVVACRRC
jgi:hypothetical protein